MGICHASVWWRVGILGVGSWQYVLLRRVRHASFRRIRAVIPRTPVHSVIRIPSIDFIMNTTTTTTSTAKTNAAATPSTSRPSSSSMPDLRWAVPVMISRMLSTPCRPGPGGHGRARDHSPHPSTSRASVGHGAGMLSPAAKRRRIVGSPAPRLVTPMPRAPLTFTTKPNHEAFSDIRLGFKDNVMRLRLLYDREVVVEMTSSSTLEGLLLDRPSWDLLVTNRDVIEHHAKIPVGDEHGEHVRVWIELKKKKEECVLWEGQDLQPQSLHRLEGLLVPQWNRSGDCWHQEGRLPEFRRVANPCRRNGYRGGTLAWCHRISPTSL